MNLLQNNIDWLQNNQNHYLYHTWKLVHNSNLNFVETCCLITAQRLAYEFTGIELDKWRKQKDIDLNIPISCIIFGEDEHMAIIKDNIVYQSYYNKKKCYNEPLSKHHIDGINNKDMELFAFNISSNNQYDVYQRII